MIQSSVRSEIFPTMSLLRSLCFPMGGCSTKMSRRWRLGRNGIQRKGAKTPRRGQTWVGTRSTASQFFPKKIWDDVEIVPTEPTRESAAVGDSVSGGLPTRRYDAGKTG